MAAVWGQYLCFCFTLIRLTEFPPRRPVGTGQRRGRDILLSLPLLCILPQPIASVCAVTARRRAREPLFSGRFGASGAVGAAFVSGRLRLRYFTSVVSAHSSFSHVPLASPQRADVSASHYFQGFPQQAEQWCCIRFRPPAFGALLGCRDRVLLARRYGFGLLVLAALRFWLRLYFSVFRGIL